MACGLCLALTFPPSVSAQRLDSFEGGQPRWRLVESDCDAQLIAHEISLIMPHSGRTCELFEVSCGSGQFVLLAYPIEPCALLDEFQPSLWVRCAAGQIRLGVRVVFPNAVHPVSQNRLTVMLWGDVYSQTGQWQRLQVNQLSAALQQQLIVLRSQWGNALNLDQPFIDSLVLNSYTGPGRYRVQVDDLDLQGMIPLASIGIPLAADWRARWQWREAEGSRFGATNQLPLWIQYRDEPLAWLKSFGLNGVLLDQAPSATQLGHLHAAAMAAISPPPVVDVDWDERDASALRGWLVGVALNRDQTELVRQQAAQVGRLPEAYKRPLYGEVLEHYWLYSRLANEVIIPSPDPASAGELADKREWLSRQLDMVRIRGSGWVSIQLDANSALVDQQRVAIEQLEGRPVERLPVNPLGLRHEVIGAVMAGARGILYRTQKPLAAPSDDPTAEDRALQAALRWCNNDLRLWSPWLVTGQKLAAPRLGRDDYTAARWRVRDAELIVAQHATAPSPWCVPATRDSVLELSLHEGSHPPQVVRLTEGRMEVMTVQTTTGGKGWQVAAPLPIEVFVITRNPQVLTYLRRRLQAQEPEYAADQLEIANYCVDQATQLIIAGWSSQPTTDRTDKTAVQRSQQLRLQEIDQGLSRGWQFMQHQRPLAASREALVVLDRSQAIIHQSYQAAVSPLATPQASPLVLNPGTLKYHWQLADACAGSRWETAPLPGSQFDDLPRMLQAGWTQQRRIEDQVDFCVELVPTSSGKAGVLRLAAFPKQTANTLRGGGRQTSPPAGLEPIPGGYEGASLRVRSAALPVRRGQLVRVTARAQIGQVGRDPQAGLLVYDNQAGPSLGQLVRGEEGERVDIELYRFVVEDGEFRILAECRGVCDVQLEQLSASVIEPARGRDRYRTHPLESPSESLYPALSESLADP